jgi:hypothetical protein
MPRIDKTVLKETKFIASLVVVLSLLMNSVFLVVGAWDYTVLLGNILSATVAVANFLFMGISIQKALANDPSDAKKIMKASQGVRNFMIFIVIGIGVLLPCFNTISAIVPLFFPRISIMFRPLWKTNEDREVIED